MSLELLFSAFIFIFLAALPGRTTFVMLLLAAKGFPKQVFIGSSLAFLIQSLISVSIGHYLAMLPQWIVHAFVGLLFLYFAYHFWRESQTIESETTPRKVTIKSVFVLVFMAEWGDVSQVAIATVSAQNQEHVGWIFIVALVALLLIVTLAVGLGIKFGNTFKPNHIQKAAAAAFALTGLYLLFTAAQSYFLAFSAA
jgi:putative Ca2+/H+ antiporter (TMEM165/GDT1 family)